MSKGKWAVMFAGLCLVVALVAIAYAAGTQAAAPVQEVVRARMFEVVDSLGKTRAVLGVSPAGLPGLEVLGDLPGLLLLNENGEVCVGLGVSSDGCPSLTLFTKDGKRRAVDLDVFPDGTPSLLLSGKHDRTRAQLTVSPDGGVRLMLTGRDGNARAGFGVAANGEGGLSLVDRNAKERVVLDVSQDGLVRLVLAGADGKGSAGLAVESDGMPKLVLGDNEGRVLWQVP